jgi:hypothetical protein
MDLTHPSGQGAKRDGAVGICTHGFSKIEVELLISIFFDKFSIDSTPQG